MCLSLIFCFSFSVSASLRVITFCLHSLHLFDLPVLESSSLPYFYLGYCLEYSILEYVELKFLRL